MTRRRPKAPSPLEGGLSDNVPEAGFMALEVVIVFAAILILALLITAFGRVGRARSLTDQAAADAARAAADAYTPGQARRDAQAAAAATLSSGGLSCQTMRLNLDTAQFHAGGQVTATLTCTAGLAGLSVSGVPGSIDLTATAGSPIDAFRATP